MSSRMVGPSALAQIVDFIVLGRPIFLGGGLVLHILGALTAAAGGYPFNGLGFVMSQLVVTAAQAMTHYANDYFDGDGDAANQNPTAWSGGSRVLPEGRLLPRVALIAAVVCAGIAAGGIAASWLLTHNSPIVIAIMLIAVLAAWFYSAPPIRLVDRTLGEITATLIVSGLTPLLGYTVQAGGVDVQILWVILPLLPIQCAMLMSVAAPDMEADRASGKLTSIVRLGREHAARLYAVLLAVGFAMLVPSVLMTSPATLASLVVFIMLPVAAWQAWLAWRGGWLDPARWEMTAFWSIAILIGTAGVELILTAINLFS